MIEPAGPWPKRPLGEAADTIFLGLALNRLSGEGAPVPVVNVRHVEGGVVQTTDLDSARALPARVARYRLEEGDVLVACRGSQLKAAVVGPPAAGAIPASNLIVVRPGPELLGSTLVAALALPSIRSQLEQRFRSSAQMVAFSVQDLASVEVPIPPLHVQKQLDALLRASEDTYAVSVQVAEARRRIARGVVRDLLLPGPGAVK